MARPVGEADEVTLTEEAGLAASWVISFCEDGLGPTGGVKLLVGEDPLVMDSPASALREADIDHPAIQPYRDLARQVQATGDQATTAVLLAARMVKHGTRLMQGGLGRAVVLDGLALARRQTLSLLNAAAREVDPAALAACITDKPWADPVLRGLRTLSEGGKLHLDDVHIHVGRRTGWLDGLVLDLPSDHPRPDVKVALLQGGPPKSRLDVAMTLRAPTEIPEDHVQWKQQIIDQGIGLLVCLGEIPETARPPGVLVLDQAPKPLVKRLAACTGAALAPALDRIDRLGVADLRPAPHRDGGWILEGPGPGATFCVEAGSFHEAVVDEAERFLRAAGTILADPRGLPGAGGWQRQVEEGLGRAADLAPGKTPLVVSGVAKAFAWEEHGDAVDSFPCAHAAVDGAFATAINILRVTGRHAAKASAGAALRGGIGPAGSPKGMPGDIPPLM